VQSKTTPGKERSPKLEQQKLLAALLRQPSKTLVESATEAFPSYLPQERLEIVSAVRRIVADALGVRLKDEGLRPAPLLKDRLSFCWKMLKDADACVRRANPDLSLGWAIKERDVQEVFADMFPPEVFHFETIEMDLLGEICSLLDLERDGRYLKSYREFLKRKKAGPIGSPLRFFQENNEPNTSHLRRVIWWLLRNHKTRFIDGSETPPRIHTEYVVKHIRKDMIELCGSRIQQWPPLIEEIENAFNRWLTYSCLDVEVAPEDEGEKAELVALFSKINKLTTALHVENAPVANTAQQVQIRELELAVERYAAENKLLEDKLAKLQQPVHSKDKAQTAPDEPLEPEVKSKTLGSPPELREVLRLIDAKYSLDVLQGLQFENESPLTLKNFLVHLFYVLRKNGLMQYPSDEEFDLSYADSGLYRCNGFEVPPDTTIRVKLIRKGWGILQRNRLFPVRLAQVQPADK
jgi:hypothetical protein